MPRNMALTDPRGYLQGRAGRWPQLVKDQQDGQRMPAKIPTAVRDDVANVARRVKPPGPCEPVVRVVRPAPAH